MKTVKLILGICSSVLVVGFAFISGAEDFVGAQFMPQKEAKKKWGTVAFDAKSFKKSSEKTKGAMAAQAIEKGAFVGHDMLKVRDQMGDPDSYFFSDTIYAYMITSPAKPGQEAWQLVFIPDEKLEKVADVKIHKKCCYETPAWAK